VLALLRAVACRSRARAATETSCRPPCTATHPPTMGDEALEPSAVDYPSRAFHDAFKMHLLIMLLVVLSFGYMSVGTPGPCYGDGNKNPFAPFVLITLLCACAVLLRLSLHALKDLKLARKVTLTAWLGAMALQSLYGIHYSLLHPAYGICPLLYQHSLHFYHIIGMPVYCLIGMLHGSFAMPLRTSLLTGLPFALKSVFTHVRHLYPFAWRQPDEEQAMLEAKVVIAGGIAVIVSWLTGLFLAHTLDASRRKLLEQQQLVQALQAARVEQLECEKQRIQYDLVFTQRELTRSQSQSVLPMPPAGLATFHGEGEEAAAARAGSEEGGNGGSWRGTWDGGSSCSSDAPSCQRIADLQQCGASTVGSCSEIGDALEAMIPHRSHGSEESSAPPGGPGGGVVRARPRRGAEETRV
jgi:hypothetical protein